MDAASLDERLARLAEHNAHVVLAEVAALAGRSPLERVGDLDAALRSARQRTAWLDRSESTSTIRARVDHHRRVLHGAVEAGLLEPARLLAELRLFD